MKDRNQRLAPRAGWLGAAWLMGCAATQPPPPTATPPVPPADENRAAGGKADVSKTTDQGANADDAVAQAAPAPDPEQAKQWLEQGKQVQRQQGEAGADAAIALYQKGIAADPECAACWWELGWSHQVKSDWGACVQAWERVRELQPSFPELDEHYPIAVMRREQAAALAALPSPESLPPPEEEPRAGRRLRIRGVGDVQLGRAWPASRATLPPKDAMELFDGVRALLKDADITFGNLETVLRDEGDSHKCGPRSTRCYAFRVPTSFAKALADAGFDAMSIANNHAGDFGEEGRKTTMKALDGVGIHHSGPIGDLGRWQTHGLRVAMIAFSTGGGSYRIQEIDTAQRAVADLARTHDIVLVSFHGGAEGSNASRVPHGVETFLGENRGDLRKFARAVIDAGADLVLGHGPHRLRGFELYRERLIAYSLGNFSSWNTFSLVGPLGITAVLETVLAPNGVLLEARLLPVKMVKPGKPVIDPKNRAIEIVRRLSKQDFGSALFDAQGEYKRPLKTSMK